MNSAFSAIADPSAAVVAFRVVAQSECRFLAARMGLAHVQRHRKREFTPAELAIGIRPNAFLA